MNLPRLSRWAAAVALVGIAPCITPAFAEDVGTLVITGVLHTSEVVGTVGSDLAAVSANGSDHAWTLTLYGATHAHQTFVGPTGLVKRSTIVHATSFDLQFDGPDAGVLETVVSQQLVGAGGGFLEIANVTSGSTWGEWYLRLAPSDPSNGVSFGADNRYWGDPTPSFAVDASGYPILPSQLVPEVTYVADRRAGNDGSIQSLSMDEVVEIAGDASAPTPAALRIQDAATIEGNRGSNKLGFRVTLDNASSQQVTVAYRTAAGTALAKSDFTAASGTLTFLPGETSKTFTVSVKSDRIVEADETLTVELYDAVGAPVADGVATGTIRNDD